MQPRPAPRARDLLQAKADHLRELALAQGAETFATLIDMLRIAEADAKERLVEADAERFQSIQGEAQIVRKLLKLLTQPKKAVSAGQE